MNIFNTPIINPILIILTIIYAVCASITTFDTRIIQAKKNGVIKESEGYVPNWTGLFGIFQWILWIVIFFLNWWYAFTLFIIKFILKVLPVLENIGALILLPVVGAETASIPYRQYKAQTLAGKKLKKMAKSWNNKDKQ